MLWEDLTAALCIAGFTAVVLVVLVELPAVVNPAFAARPTADMLARLGAFTSRYSRGLHR